MSTKTSLALVILGFALSAGHSASAMPTAIENHSFEADTNTVPEFFFGARAGWSLIDAGGIVANDDPGIIGIDTHGTLTVTGGNYFGGVAPEGNNVAILFIGEEVSSTEIGIGQVLGTGLASNTAYQLEDVVGNIDSGKPSAFGFFDLAG